MGGMKLKPENYVKFSKSRDWGYYPPEVEKAIEQYEDVIGRLNERLVEKVQECERLKARNAKLEDECRRMHIEMSSIELPDTEEVVENVVLQDFRRYNSPMPEEMDIQPPKPGDKMLGLIDIDAEESSDVKGMEQMQQEEAAGLFNLSKEGADEEEATLDVLNLGKRERNKKGDQKENSFEIVT
jgi:hypothetical protein